MRLQLSAGVHHRIATVSHWKTLPNYGYLPFYSTETPDGQTTHAALLYTWGATPATRCLRGCLAGKTDELRRIEKALN